VATRTLELWAWHNESGPSKREDQTLTKDQLLDRLQSVKPNGAGWIARCPAHEDHKPSLTIAEGEHGRILLKCHAGCTTETICGALGIKLADLFDGKAAHNGREGKLHIVANYDYVDESGKLLFQVCRTDPKDFRQRRPDPSVHGGWSWTTKGVRRVLFRLPQVMDAAKSGRPVYVCEGEKDVLAIEHAGFVATTNPGGAGKWLDSYSETLRGIEVIVIADKDVTGRKHAGEVAAKLQGAAASVKVIELPDTNGTRVKDAADYFAAGGQAADLDELASNAPDWKSDTEQTVVTPTESGELTSGIHGVIISLLLDKELPVVARRSLIARKVMGALSELGRFYFHADLRDFESAMFFDTQRKRLERIRSDAFGAWLSEWLNVNRADTLFRFILAEIETAALSGSNTTAILPETFWAATPEAIYLSNGDGQVVRIRSDGVQSVDNGTDGVLFRAGRTLDPWRLTTPADPFANCGLFGHAHCTAAHGLDLLRLWLYSLPTSPKSKPPLCFVGEIGSGKTRLAKGITELYGLPFLAAKVEEQAEDNFWPNIDQGGILTLDNADSKCRWLADAMASAATDGCSVRRRLYTDSEQVTLRARAWLCVTTANPTFANDAGLADRLLVVRMERRDEETSDAALTDNILAARDAALSHIAMILQKALADTDPTPARLNERHPDFAAFAVRIGRALGDETSAVTALRAAEVDKSAFCLENDSIGSALLAYLDRAESFEGTAAELIPKLHEIDPELKDKLSSRRLGKWLVSLMPHLQKALAVARKEPDRNKINVFTFQS
jgi:hypothetical protein